MLYKVTLVIYVVTYIVTGACGGMGSNSIRVGIVVVCSNLNMNWCFWYDGVIF